MGASSSIAEPRQRRISPEIIITSPGINESSSANVTKNVEDVNYLSPRRPYQFKSDLIDPFEHKLSPNLCDILKIGFMSVTLAPLRLFFIFFLLFFGWIVAKIGLCGLAGPDLEKPFVSWRQSMQGLLMKTFRCVFFCMGFYKINVIGHQVK